MQVVERTEYGAGSELSTQVVERTESGGVSDLSAAAQRSVQVVKGAEYGAAFSGCLYLWSMILAWRVVYGRSLFRYGYGSIGGPVIIRDVLLCSGID